MVGKSSLDQIPKRARSKEHWDKFRDYDYRRNYGIGIADYNRMFEEQGGKCAICEKHQTEFNKRLHVDHCHTTKKVRGLLCHNCNLAIGRLGENIQTLKNAIRYLTW